MVLRASDRPYKAGGAIQIAPDLRLSLLSLTSLGNVTSSVGVLLEALLRLD